LACFQTPETTLLQLKRRKLELLQALKDKVTGGIVPRADGGSQSTPEQAMLRAGTERFANSLLGVPDLIVNATVDSTFGKAKRDVMGLLGPDLLPPTPDEFLQSLGTRRLPLPSGADVLTATDAAGEAAAGLATGDLSQFSPNMAEASRMRSEVMAQQQSGASAVGSLLGDVATLATGRAPVSKLRGMQIANAAERQALLKAEMLKAKEAGIITSPLMADSVPAMLQRMTTNSRGFGSLMEKTGRIAETGLEGAVLAILTDGDPLETAAYSAGTQAAGNVVLGMMPGGDLAKIGLAAVAATTLFQIANSLLPGGEDRILPAVESGFNKVALGLTAGLMMGVAGTGRLTSKAMPVFADQFTAAFRSGTISVINDMQQDPAAQRIVQRLSVDPNYFGPTAGRRLERAFRNPNISISGVIDDLMEQKAFRQKYEALEKSQ
jgi:hypothetical protein